jgi:VanZ family protein
MNALRWIANVGPTARWLIWIVFLTAWTVALLTPQPVQFARDVLPQENAIYYSKSLHVAAYMVLAVLTGWLQVTYRVRWICLAFLSFHAFATEFLQQFVPSRSGSLRDVALDHVGLALGLILTIPWWRPASGDADSNDKD